MSGRAQPILLVLALAVAVAAAWFLFLRDDEGGSAGRDDDGSGRESAPAEELHGVKAELFHLPYKDAYRGQLQVAVDPEAFPAGRVDLPQIYEVELRFLDMEPPLMDAESTGLLHRGWNERDVAGGYRFFTIDAPVPQNGSFVKWQIQFDTSLEPGVGPRLKSGRLRFYGREGDLIGVKQLTIR